jgi:hypothetical protein
MSLINGPGEGTWSVYAEKLQEKLDVLEEKNKQLRQTIEDLNKALKQYGGYKHCDICNCVQPINGWCPNDHLDKPIGCDGWGGKVGGE